MRFIDESKLPEGLFDRWQAGTQTEADELVMKMLFGMRPLSPEDRALADQLQAAAQGRTVILNARLEKGTGRLLSQDPFFIGCAFVGAADA